MKKNELNYFNVGYRYETGSDDYIQDFEKAIEHYILAGEEGNPEGYVRAGIVYQFYIGNVNKAVSLYQKAIDAGSANGTFCLGNCYYNGDGVTKDILKGCKLRNQALNDGSPMAQVWFAKMTKQYPSK